MAYSAPTVCPVCGAVMQVTRLRCQRCESELSGCFVPCRFCALPQKELRFIETFLRCRGSIKDVERELGVSYPTVRNMLDSALSALGYNAPGAPSPGSPSPGQPSPGSPSPGQPSPGQPSPGARREILDMLDRGEIDAKEALRRLKTIDGEEKS